MSETRGDLPMQDLNVRTVPLAGVQLIEASAGTGKTWNICALVLRLLLEQGLEVSQLLVVTFTQAATAELRERIRARLVDALALLRDEPSAPADAFLAGLLDDIASRGPDRRTMAERLDLAQQTFDEAAVLTIHGYCQRALGDAPFTARMPLALDLLADDRELVAEVVHDFWRRHLAGPALDPALAVYLTTLGDTPERHRALLQRRLARPLATLRWPEGLDDAAGAAAPSQDPDLQRLLQAHTQARALWLAEREAILSTIDQALPRLNGTSYKPHTAGESARQWDVLLAEGGSDAAIASTTLPTAQTDRLDRLASATLQTKTKKGQTPPSHAFFDAAQALLEAREAAARLLRRARLRLLRELLGEGPDDVRRRKRQRRLLAFDDMLYNLHERLTGPDGPALAAALRQRFPAALIDEFQDTDPLQWSIFETIYGDGTAPLFLVGDPKQAIYSFRQADLPTYLRARGRADAVWTLRQNQRSSPALIAALNALFDRHPRPFLREGLAYPRVSAGAKPRPPFDDRSAARAPLDLWRLPGGADADSLLAKGAAKALAATTTAREIARLLTAAQRGEVRLAGRALGAGDIAVLVRSHREGRQMREALAACGVGSVELSQASVLASREAEALSMLLQSIAEPGRERLLRTALATELMGRDAGDLLALADDESALLRLVERFAGYRDDWQRLGIGTMLRRWMRGEDVPARLLSRPDGERRLTNLLHLAEQLQQAAQTHGAPEALRRWFDAARRDAAHDEATQLRLESDRHLVQIVTVHKSKGLEYPLVYVPFAFDGALRGEAGDDAVLVREPDGRATLDFRVKGEGDFDAEAVKREALLDAAAERLRLIYVALTRAVHRCTVVVGPYAVPVGKGRSTKEAQRSALAWLVAADRTPEDWFGAKPGPASLAAVDDAWAALVTAAEAGHPGALALRPPPELPPQWLATDESGAASLAAAPPPRTLPQAWRIGSYSHLLHGATHEAAARDHDGAAEAPAVAADEAAEPEAPTAALIVAAASEDASGPDDGLLDYPRGAAAGDSLHALLEAIDFTAPAGWPAATARVLQQHPLALPGQTAEASAPPLGRMLDAGLAALMHTPLRLPGSDAVLRLAELPRARRAVEWPFHLPAPRLDAAALARLLDAHGIAMPRLAFPTLQGYLKGYVDLLFEHEGCVYLLDWKSNHLGRRPQDYAGASLAAAMAEHGYHLQHLLYAVALRRALAWRAPGSAARYGGVLYLFLRGVRPDWTQPDGQAGGVWAAPPDEALLDDLDALLRDGAGR